MKKQSETIAIVGFVFSFLIPIVGLILSVIGLRKAKNNNSSKGLLIAGLIISVFGLLIRLLLIVLAIFAFIKAAPDAKNFVTKTIDKMCAKVERCDNMFGDFYTCYYKEGAVDYTITCPEDNIPDGIIDKKEKDDILPKDSGYTLEDFEKMALDYYEYKTEIKLEKAIATILNNNKVEIKLYHDENLNNPIIIYIIDKDTLVGKDANGLFVDLTEAIRDDL